MANRFEEAAVRVEFTVIETMRYRARAEVEESQFAEDTGVSLSRATDEELALYLVGNNHDYQVEGTGERLEDPVVCDFTRERDHQQPG